MVNNLIRREWFSQKSCDASLHQSVESILSNKSSAQNNWYVGSNLAQPMKRLFSVHERHCQIAQNHLECLRLSPESIESFKTRLRGHDLVTCFATSSLDKDQRHLFVINNEDGHL